MFSKLLIANRGEIACRIIRTAKAMGLRTVAVFSEADRSSLHVELADDAVFIGPPEATASYLDVAAVMRAARETKAEAVHPGYGFLSENAGFARTCAEEGLVFVGPPPSAIDAMGAKDTARGLMEEAGVPVVPGYDGDASESQILEREAAAIGYPVLVKAALGGGGKGMRRVDQPQELAEAVAGARREAEAAFGDGRVFLEKFIASARHIEVQVFADRHGNAVHLFERDCSLQRRHQKVIEEAPAPGMTAGLRDRMTGAATAAARAVGYEGAGTVEFIVDASAPLDDGTSFYFLEMNTRLQVEHPVTELVTGLDLVEWQLRVAAGEPLPSAQPDIGLSGHAIEARLYAEDPATGFLPSTGRLLAFDSGAEPDVRIDTGVRAGDMITPFYDPMIAKVVAHAGDRDAARTRLRDALAGLVVAGPRTNQAFLAGLLDHTAFRQGLADTGLIDRAGDDLPGASNENEAQLRSLGIGALLGSGADREHTVGPWSILDGFQLGPPRRMRVDVVADGKPASATAEWAPDGRLLIDGFDAGAMDGHVFRDGEEMVAVGQGRQMRIRRADPGTAMSDGPASGNLVAPMPGRIAHVGTVVGARVRMGETLAVVEAMKMEHALRAPFDGTVRELNASEGEQVDQNTPLVLLDPDETQ